LQLSSIQNQQEICKTKFAHHPPSGSLCSREAKTLVGFALRREDVQICATSLLSRKNVLPICVTCWRLKYQCICTSVMQNGFASPVCLEIALESIQKALSTHRSIWFFNLDSSLIWYHGFYRDIVVNCAVFIKGQNLFLYFKKEYNFAWSLWKKRNSWCLSFPLPCLFLSI
jgi:hypothetical protein